MQRTSNTELRQLLLLWTMLGTAALIGAGLFAISDIRVDIPASATRAWTIVTGAGAGGAALLWIGWRRCGVALSSLALLACLGAIGSMISLPIATFSSGYTDDALAGADAALGLDWRAYFQFLIAHPYLRDMAKVGYYLFIPVSALLAMTMALLGHGERVLTCLTAATLAVFIALVALLFGPAAGPFVHFAIDPALIAGTNPNTLLTSDVIELARSGGMVTPLQMSGGLVSIPSIHTAGGLLTAWLAWREWRLRAALVPFTGALLIATPVDGSHYFVDMFAGAITAGIALRLALDIERRCARSFLSPATATAASPALV